MFDFQNNIKRQIQILGLCLSGNNGKIVRVSDLAELFDVEDLTIKRDLNNLRTLGIDIHSRKKEGIQITSSISNQKLKEIILHLIGLCYTEQSLDRSTFLLVEKYGAKALENIVLLQLCIDKTFIAKIKYWNETDTEYISRNIMPLLIFQNEGSWRVLVQENEKFKQFLLEKISDIVVTDKRFIKISQKNFDELFSYSWKSWISNNRFFVKLKISRQWAEKIKHRILITNQKITEYEDGSILFEATVNSLSEISGWIVSRGEGIIVLEPEELKLSVINLAKGVLKNY